jgi:hypothetical protein
MVQRPRSTDGDDIAWRVAHALTRKPIPNPLNRKIWQLYNFYARFFSGLKVRNSGQQNNIQNPISAARTSNFYAEYLIFRTQQREYNKTKH